jgi:hypothetical protein
MTSSPSPNETPDSDFDYEMAALWAQLIDLGHALQEEEDRNRPLADPADADPCHVVDAGPDVEADRPAREGPPERPGGPATPATSGAPLPPEVLDAIIGPRGPFGRMTREMLEARFGGPDDRPLDEEDELVPDDEVEEGA